MSRSSKNQKTFTVYFGGELFSAKHLIGNAYLAEAIYERSHGRFQCLLPQNNPVRGHSRKAIRDMALRSLAECDLAIFNYDGADLDAGTVVEFIFAKFADIPVILLRTDGRFTSLRSDPWTLMSSYYPRTISLVAESLPRYRQASAKHIRLDETNRLAGQYSTAAAQIVCDRIAPEVVRALERLLRTEPVMPKHLREEAYNWLPLLAGLRGHPKTLRKEFERILERKVQRDLL